MYDIVIVGAGPAGLTAALYALRADKKVLVLEKETFGGQITYSPNVENYPGFLKMSGNEFAEKLLDQVLTHGAEVELAEVTGITAEGKTRIVKTAEASYATRSVILATGARHRTLGLDGEAELIGNGISFCARCDGAFYSGREVAVIGGGNSALQEAVLLSDVCKSVTIVQNLPKLTGEARLQKTLAEKENVRIVCSHTVDAYLTNSSGLSGIRIKDADSGELRELAVDGVFLAVGLVPQNAPFAENVTLNDWGYVDADESCTTKDPAIFTAGDCRQKRVRQIATAISDGAAAALAACHYLDE